MSRSYIDSYLNELHRQIAGAAARIKQKNVKGSDNYSKEMLHHDFEKLFASHVEIQAYDLVSSEAAYSLIGQNIPADNNYAAGIYSITSKIDKKSSVVEGLVFKNNKEFDFKV